MILVTGHSGFIGSHLWRALDYQDDDLDMIGMDPRGQGFKPDEWPDVVRRYGDELEAIFHMGAISDTTCEDWRALVQTNMVLPCTLLDFCQEKKIPFIYASSASVYGNGAGPLNAYARSKRDFDIAAQIQIDEGRDQIYGLRFFNVYGPGEEHKGAQASMVHQFLNGRNEMFAPEAKRDFIHVDDVVSVMIWMWKNRPPSGIYDVGTGRARSFRELAWLCGKPLCGVVPMPKSLEGKYQFNTQADLTKLRAAGYDRPFLSLEEGIMLCA